MGRRGPTSIGRRLTTINTLVSGAALVLACLAFGAYDRSTAYDQVIENLLTEAQIVGTNSVAALAFDEPAAAETSLAALRAAPNIVSAAIHTPEGRLFALYRRDAGGPIPAPMAIAKGKDEAHYFGPTRLRLPTRSSSRTNPWAPSRSTPTCWH